MTTKQLEYVIAVAKGGSFSQAAEELNISQPSLSQYIKKIEQQLGTELFDRSGWNVRLTDAGEAYIETGKKILELERQLQSRISDIQDYRSGTLIVGTSPYRSSVMMPETVRAFRENYPGIRPIIREMTSSELLEEAERGQFDLCVTVGPVNAKLFDSAPIMEEEVVLAVPAPFDPMPAVTMTGRRHPALDAAKLDGQSFIMINENQLMQKTLEEICREYGITVNTAAVVKSIQAQIAMVRAGVGMALVPSGAEKLCGSEVRFYSLQQECARRQVAAIWQKGKDLSVVSRAFLSAMQSIEW